MQQNRPNSEGKMPDYILDLAQALEEHILPIFERNGMSLPYYYVEENTDDEGGDGGVVLHVEWPDADSMEEL